MIGRQVSGKTDDPNQAVGAIFSLNLVLYSDIISLLLFPTVLKCMRKFHNFIHIGFLFLKLLTVNSSQVGKEKYIEVHRSNLIK